jgi:hypothetical protein
MNEIKDIMLNEHKYLRQELIEISLISNLLKDDIILSLDKFKNNLQKHFLIEEKVIFSSLIGSKDINIMFKLLNDHKLILEKLNNQINLKSPEISELMNIFEDHTKFESEEFYLRLEDLLSTKEINDITKNYYEFI